MEAISMELIRLAQSGDADAFSQIYNQCYKHVYTYALRLCGNEADAKDIAQETFLQIHKSIQSLQSPEAFPLWLNRIVYSKFHRILAKRREAALEQDQLNYHVDQSDRAKKLNDTYLLDDKEIIRQMIDQLSDKQREAIQYMYYDQYTTNEIAQKLGLPEGTIKSRIFEAKKALQKQIKEFEKTEKRKIILHNDSLLPAASLTLFARWKDWLCFGSHSQKLLSVAMVSMVVISTVAVSETIPYIRQSYSETQETLPKESFQPVHYQNTTISNAKAAYYTLMKWASDASHIEQKNAAEKAEIKPVLDELKHIDSPYYERLSHDGWLEAYEK